MERNIFSGLNQYFNNVVNHGNSDASLMYMYEGMRLKSFHSVNINTSYIRLASAGFFATKNGDETRCYSCGVTYRGWAIRDNPLQIHRQISPSCRHVADTPTANDEGDSRVLQFASRETSEPITNPEADNSHCENKPASVASLQHQLRLTQSTDTRIGASATLSTPRLMFKTEVDSNAPNILTATLNPSEGGRDSNRTFNFEDATYPHYSGLIARLKTFVTWPQGHCKKPEDLVQAGFFFAGYSDCVRCFVCGVGLRTWEEDDDPWLEHVRWRSSCNYVNAVKGQDFVLQTLGQIGRQNRSGIEGDRLSPASAPKNATADIMDTVACRRALQMGFDNQHVKHAAMVISNAQGRLELTLDVLVERLILDEEDTTASDYPRHTAAALQDVGTRQHAHMPKDTACPRVDNTQLQTLQPVLAGHKLVDASRGKVNNVFLPNNRSPSVSRATSVKEGRNRGNATEAKSASMPSSSQTTEEENRELKESSLCKVCLDDQANIVFLPCGHLVACATCSPALDKCPVCRKHIRGTVRVHLANKASVLNDL